MSNQEIPIFKHFAIELHSDCNRDCYFCPRYGDKSGKRKDPDGNHARKKLPTEKILELMDQVKAMGYKGKINFHHLSEPFLDKRLLPIAIEAKKRGFESIIHTNGDLLKKNYKMCRRTAAVFSEVTVGLYDYKNTFQKKIQQIVWKWKLRGTDLHFSKVENVFPRHNVDMCRANMHYYKEKVVHAVNTPCFMAQEHLIVHYDGNVGICCEDYKDEFNVGNVFENTIDEIWWSDRHIEILHNLSQPGGRNLYPLCRKCPFPAEIVNYTIDKS